MKNTRKVYVAAWGKDAGKGLLVDVGTIPGAERWTSDRNEALHLTPAQARKVIDVLRRAGITAATSC